MSQSNIIVGECHNVTIFFINVAMWHHISKTNHNATTLLMKIVMWQDIWWMPQYDIDINVAIQILQSEITIKEIHNAT